MARPPELCPHGVLGKEKCAECRRAWDREKVARDPERYHGYALAADRRKRARNKELYGVVRSPQQQAARFKSDHRSPEKRAALQLEGRLHYRKPHAMARIKYQAQLRRRVEELARCACCTTVQIAAWWEKCPEGHERDHIIALADGGMHCLKNLQYLLQKLHRSKSGAENTLRRNKVRWLRDNLRILGLHPA